MDNLKKRDLEKEISKLMRNKAVSPEKKGIIYSLLENDDLLLSARYDAIVELLDNCPEKSEEKIVTEKKITPVKKTVPKKAVKKVASPKNSSAKNKKVRGSFVVEPLESSREIESLFQQYQDLGFFKKRFLAKGKGIFFFRLRKRLVPTKKLVSFILDFNEYKNFLLEQLNYVFEEMLKDEDELDPFYFNYLRYVARWLNKDFWSTTNFTILKLRERQDWEVDSCDFIRTFFSVKELDLEVKEQLISLVDEKLHNCEKYKKQEILDTDTDTEKRKKEKKNLRNEKNIFETVLLFRFFISADVIEPNTSVKIFAKKYGINTLAEFILIYVYCLIYQRKIDQTNLKNWLKIKNVKISKERWDYNISELKKYGKDTRSRKERELKILQRQLEPYDAIKKYLTVRYKGSNILDYAFTFQWKLLRKKRIDCNEVYEQDFFTYIEECVMYFKNYFLVFFNGEKINFKTKDGEVLSGSLFDENYFSRELKLFDDLISEINYYRSSNPVTPVTYAEVVKIMKGQITSFSHIERFIRIIGSLFYDFSAEILKLLELHVWALENPDNCENRYQAVDRDYVAECQHEKKGAFIPFYDTLIQDLPKSPQLTRSYAGGNFIGKNRFEGILPIIVSFSLQLAQQCFDENLQRNSEYYQEIRLKIRNLKKSMTNEKQK